MNLDVKRTGLIAVGGIAGGSVFVFNNTIACSTTDLSGLVGTIFSVLAGLLAVALNLIVMSKAPNFKSAISNRKYTKLLNRRLRRQNWLFYSYLTILVLVFFSEMTGIKHPEISKTLRSIYLGLATASLIWSFGIPAMIVNIHNENLRLVEIMEKKDKKTSTGNNS